MLERIAFLLDDSGERVSALLNPDSIRLRRQSGLRRLDDRPGTITGAQSSDDALIATSGGRTEMELDLLFDVELLPANPNVEPVADVRTMTGPLWSLSENRSGTTGPPTCRVVWGKHFNVAAIVESVSERLERFDAAGAPARSYVSLRLLRTAEPEPTVEPVPVAPAPAISTAETTPRAPLVDAPDSVFHEVLGSEGGGERLDQLAARYYGNAEYWRHLAAVNGIDDPPWVAPGRILVIPSIEVLAKPEPQVDTAGLTLDVDTELQLDPSPLAGGTR